MRIPCAKCDVEILESTATANGGLCAPCAKGAGSCSVCGGRVWEANLGGEFIHIECADRHRGDQVAVSSCISWDKPDDIDWDALLEAILRSTRGVFERLAAAHPKREVKAITLAYRIGEGIRVEPCVTFLDGEYLNASLDDDSLFCDLEPYDRAVTRIEESLDDNQLELFIEMLESKAPEMMAAVFKFLDADKFGLPLIDECEKILKDF